MAREVFAVPEDPGKIYVEWNEGETERIVRYGYREVRTPQTMVDKEGNEMTIDQVVNAGYEFTAVRGQGTPEE